MELDIDFSPLVRLRKKIGARFNDLSLAGIRAHDPKIEIEEILNTSYIEGAASNLDWDVIPITHEGVQAILYIKDTEQYIKDIRKKFHIILPCQTLTTMKKRGSFKKYVKTRRRSGIFKVDAFKDEWKTKKIETEVKLDVCQNCLEKINWKGFADLPHGAPRIEAVKKFNIGEFLDEYAGIFIDYGESSLDTDNTAPLAEYTLQYFRKSPIVKKRTNYCCAECGVNLSKRRALLHCHHKDHVKYNNKWSNLVAICAACHKNNHHPHMYVSPEDIREIKRLRKEQGIGE